MTGTGVNDCSLIKEDPTWLGDIRSSNYRAMLFPCRIVVQLTWATIGTRL
jgi:hypothetical protein